MRGIGQALSRHPAARVLIAGAAILAGVAASASPARADGSGNGNDQSAMAVARVRIHGGDAGIALPEPLSPSDAAQVQRIFSLQAQGDIPAARQAVRHLDDTLLLGAILADRYLGRHHRASIPELTAWLNRYGSQPDAFAVHALLVKRLHKGGAPRPAELSVPTLPSLGSLGPETDESATEAPVLPRNPALERTVMLRLQAGDEQSALRLIDGTRGLAASEEALLRAKVARALFTRNRDADSLSVAADAFLRAPPDARPTLPAFVAGLAAWRLGDAEQAVGFFAAAARAPLASSEDRAAAAWWAARASQSLDDADEYDFWLRAAAQDATAFYGMLAARALHSDERADLLSQVDLDAIAETGEGRRAFALLQVEQISRAEAELRCLAARVQGDTALSHSIRLVAGSLGFTDLAAQLGMLAGEAPRVRLPRRTLARGFRLDPALVYGLARLESNFDPEAVSPMGARGLMQIMPETAQYIAGNPSLAERRLHDPALNLDLGQRYVAHLARDDVAGDNLIRVLASYNAGPGNVGRWDAEMNDQDDPLLYIESIPIEETRNFVKHVLAYTWRYAMLFALPAPSLDELAEVRFPSFTAPAPRSTLVAADAPLLH
jgi:soluble lytic murein transglycosylase-like protein